MTRSLSLIFLFIVSASLLTSAQNSPPAAKASFIAGTVIKEPWSEPLKKVLVQVVAENQKVGGNYTALTDNEGHFHIENVEPGRYHIFLERTGFVAVNDRGVKADINIVTVQSQQSVENLLFRMLTTAVISGRITDEDGDPMSEVRVIAQLKKSGKMKRERVGMAATNDLGEYRIAGLFPGQYSVAAMPPPDFRDYEKPQKPAQSSDSPAAQIQNDSKFETRYLTTYYPGTLDAAQSSTVDVKAGDDVPVNFTLLPSRTYRVRGIVTGLSASDKPTIELRSKSGDSNLANAGDIGPDGQFEVRGVAPGSYSVLAIMGAESRSPSLSARQDITVVAGDVDGIKLSPIASFKLSGHLRIEGESARNVAQYRVNLRPARSQEDSSFYGSPEDYFGTNASVDRIGNFEWKDVPPGNYMVEVVGGEPGKIFLKSAKLGDRDIETGFTATGPASLDLVVSSKGGVVEGTVLEREKAAEKDQPAANTTVVAVPEEKYRKIVGHFGFGETDQNGHFIIRGLAPGDYTLYAWEDVDADALREPDFFKSHQGGGTIVKVEENSKQQVELRALLASQE